MKVVAFGPGRVGCGFVGHVFNEAGHEVVFVARTAEMASHLNRVGRYRVRLVSGREVRESVVSGVRAVSAAQPGEVVEELADADLVTTSVRVANLQAVAPLIAAGLARRRRPVDVVAFENSVTAGSDLKVLVTDHARDPALGERHGFAGCVVERAISRRVGDPAGNDPLVVVGDFASRFVIDGSALKLPIPDIDGLVLAHDFSAWAQRKLHTYSTGHAAAAYLGSLKGYRFVHAAVRDPEVRTHVLGAMGEGRRGLVHRYGEAFVGRRRGLSEILRRFENAALEDLVVRVARDPVRKLGRNDRIVGAGIWAARAGLPPRHLALAAAAALQYHHPGDDSSERLRSAIERSGVETVLHRACGLEPGSELWRLILDRCLSLGPGTERDGVFLHLDPPVRAWLSFRESA